MVLLALLPIIWLIVALGFLPGYKACPVAVIIFGSRCRGGFSVYPAGSVRPFWKVALAYGLFCGVAAIFAYNLTVYTKSMDVIKQMLTTVSKDGHYSEILLIAWGVPEPSWKDGRLRYGRSYSGQYYGRFGISTVTIHSGVP